MTDQQQKPMDAVEAARQHLNAALNIMAEARDRSITQLAALVAKAGGEVRLDFAEIEALNRETHMLDVQMDETGMTLHWKRRPPAPQPKKTATLIGLNGQPLNGGGS